MSETIPIPKVTGPKLPIGTIVKGLIGTDGLITGYTEHGEYIIDGIHIARHVKGIGVIIIDTAERTVAKHIYEHGLDCEEDAELYYTKSEVNEMTNITLPTAVNNVTIPEPKADVMIMSQGLKHGELSTVAGLASGSNAQEHARQLLGRLKSQSIQITMESDAGLDIESK